MERYFSVCTTQRVALMTVWRPRETGNTTCPSVLMHSRQLPPAGHYRRDASLHTMGCAVFPMVALFVPLLSAPPLAPAHNPVQLSESTTPLWWTPNPQEGVMLVVSCLCLLGFFPSQQDWACTTHTHMIDSDQFWSNLHWIFSFTKSRKNTVKFKSFLGVHKTNWKKTVVLCVFAPLHILAVLPADPASQCQSPVVGSCH